MAETHFREDAAEKTSKVSWNIKQGLHTHRMNREPPGGSSGSMATMMLPHEQSQGPSELLNLQITILR